MKTKSMNLALIMGAVLLPALTVSVNAIPIPIEAAIPSSKSSKASAKNLKNTADVGSLKSTSGRKASKGSEGQLGSNGSNKASKNSNARGKNRGANVDSLTPVVAGFGKNSAGKSLSKKEAAKLAALSGITPSVAGVTYTTTDTNPIINVPGATTVAQGVPDGGATALLLGISVCGFGWLKRKIAPIQ